MSVYTAVRDWVDKSWHGSAWRALPIPAMVPALLSMVIDSKTLVVTAWVWFAVWTAFVLWRWWLMMKTAAGKADQAFDKEGKFKLSKDYWSTESATAASKRRQNG